MFVGHHLFPLISPFVFSFRFRSYSINIIVLCLEKYLFFFLVRISMDIHMAWFDCHKDYSRFNTIRKLSCDKEKFCRRNDDILLTMSIRLAFSFHIRAHLVLIHTQCTPGDLLISPSNLFSVT